MSATNALATLAVVAALVGGSTLAFAASTQSRAKLEVTGAHVKNSSLTGRDVKNAALASSDFEASARTKLRIRGAAGDTGAQGPVGNTGAQGKVGDAGDPAPRAFTFQFTERNGHVGGDKPNPNGSELNGMDCAEFPDMVGCPTAPIRFPRWNYRCTWLGDGGTNKHCNTTSAAVPQLTRSFQTVLVTAENPNGGLLSVPYDATIAMNATATFFTQRTAVRQRLECQLQLARVENGLTQAPVNVGLPIVQYRHVDTANLNHLDRLLNIGVTGAIDVTAGTFETFLACRAPDDDGQQSSRLEFIEGNVIVLSTRTNGKA
jgi:hypothetical protein